MELKRKTISVDEYAAETPAALVLPPEVKGHENKPAIKGPEDRFYLPVLNINHTKEWDGKPVSERKLWTDQTAMETCLGNCCGVEGLKGACCHLDPVDLEHVLGPLDERWINDTIRWFRKYGGMPLFSREDLVIDYEEGKILGNTLFKDAPNNVIFQQKKAYPFLRFQVLGPRYACKFMNPKTYKCLIYPVRPEMCRTYLCQHVLTNFLVKTENKPNTWQRVR
jgi:Fe-S-cluster containining protein